MATTTTPGVSVLGTFLRLVVFALMAILIAIPLCMLLDVTGVFDALGWKF